MDVIIIGAGAAGLMCAIEAGARGRKVLVLDKSNKAGKKILMSGLDQINIYVFFKNIISLVWVCPQHIPGGGEILPGKLTLGKILSEISGQYFYQGFKPRDKNFPTVFKKSPISSGHRLKI